MILKNYRQIYTFENICKEDNSVFLKDGSVKALYVVGRLYDKMQDKIGYSGRTGYPFFITVFIIT